MKEKLTRNIGLKILSIILAALLWIVITNIENPIIKDTYTNVRVDVINESALTSLGQIYSIVEGGTIDINFSARRKIWDELSVSDFKVTADLSKLSDVDAVTIKITCPRYRDQVTILNDYQVMKIEREELVKKQFKVNVEQKGDPAEGYYVYGKKTNTLLNVTGPKSKVDSISQIVVEVDVTNSKESFRISERPKALDVDGDVIDSSNLTFSEDFIPANIYIYKTKIINLKIVATGTPADGYTMADIDYEPKKIEIAAEDSVLGGIHELLVEEDITGANKDIQKEINIQEQLKEGIILVEKSQTAAINITIEKAETKEISLYPGEIDVRNKPDNLSLAYLVNAPILLYVIGPAKEIKDISYSNIKPYIDLSDFSSGIYSVEIKVDLGGYSTLLGYPKVNISLV